MTITDSAREFLYANARVLERRRFDGDAAAVVDALRAYRNADGGFGNGLEPDKRCAASQPIDQEVALRILDEAGAVALDLVAGVCDFLETITTPDGGVPFVLPTVREAARAPWWNTDDDPPASINPTASIAGLLHRLGAKHAWLDGATDFCWLTIGGSATEDVHDLLSSLLFLENTPDRDRAVAELESIGKRILAANLVALDPAATGYVKKPLDWAPTPYRWCRRLFGDAVIEDHLDALEAAQSDDGGWPVSWEPPTPAAVLEARGMLTVDALTTLRSYGRV